MSHDGGMLLLRHVQRTEQIADAMTAAWNVVASPLQLEASAQAPCTRTRVGLVRLAGKHVFSRCVSEDSATLPPEVFGVAALAAPPPPQAATASAATVIITAPARKVIGLLRVMSLLRWWSIDSHSNER